MAMKVLIKHLRIHNYKSIGHCSVELGQFTVLVGRNGAGKSNFLDALRFVSESLQSSLDHAIKARGGIDTVRRRSQGHPRNFGVELQLILSDYTQCTYGFEIGALPKGGFFVKQERLRLFDHDGSESAHFHIAKGQVVSCSVENAPEAMKDRLYLVTASGHRQFRKVFDALISMGFYNLNPDAMKELQSPDAGELLHRDGSNVASVVSRLKQDSPGSLLRLREYLADIVPSIKDFARESLGPRETLAFKQAITGAASPWTFYAASMSDGTLRALGILVAVMQLVGRKTPICLVGVEEPETALHPSAAGALMDALLEATDRTQVIVTTHSADLLDQIDLDKHHLLAVVSDNNDTLVSPIDAASRDAIRKHLYSAGELLRMDQLDVDRDDLRKRQPRDLFSGFGDTNV